MTSRCNRVRSSFLIRLGGVGLAKVIIDTTINGFASLRHLMGDVLPGLPPDFLELPLR